MSIFRPATPGFLVTLLATILLGVVSFGVPILHSVYFLQASNVNVENFNGTITLGTLGYCIEQSNGTTCSKPSVGYEFDPNALLGDDIDFAQIPDVVVKWITYVLVLHIVGFAISAISAFMGLLAHCHQFAASCFSSCIAGLAAAVTLLAFIFDVVLFFLAKDRIDSVSGASAVIGNAVWLTLAAWVLLLLSSCFYTFGRCCIRSRPRDQKLAPYRGNDNDVFSAKPIPLDAVKYDVDRRRRQQQGEAGLPAFQEHQPLSSRAQYLEDEDEDGYTPAGTRQPSQPNFPGGYAPAAPTQTDGTYLDHPPHVEAYSPSRQGSQHTQGPSNYADNAINNAPAGHTQYPSNTNYPQPLNPTSYADNAASNAFIGHAQYPPNTNYTQPANRRERGYTSGATSYHSTSSHVRGNTVYSQTSDGYNEQPAFDAATYVASSGMPLASPQALSPQPLLRDPHSYISASPSPQPLHDPHSYITASPSPQPFLHDPYAAATSYAPHGSIPPQRSYTLGGGGYQGNVVPNAYGGGNEGSYSHFPGSQPEPYADNHWTPALSAGANLPAASVPNGPRAMVVTNSSSHDEMEHDDSPPQYDEGLSAYPPAAWSEKH